MRRALVIGLAVTLLLVSGNGAGLLGAPIHGAGQRTAGFRFAAAGGDGPLGIRPVFHPTMVAPPVSAPTTTVIEANGSISNASTPISQSNGVYTLTASFSGQLLVERNNSRLTASSVTVTGTNASIPVIEIYGVHDLTIDHLTIAGYGSGLTVAASVRVGVSDLTIATTDAPGIAVVGSQSTTVQNATVAGTSGVGVLVQGSEGILVYDSNASGRPSGVALDHSLNASVSSNDLVGCRVGVNASSDTALVVRDNRLSGTQVGVNLTGVTSASLAGDVALSPQVGLSATETTFLNATGESYTTAGTGVSLVASYGVNLTGNNLTGDNQPVVAVSSGGLTIAHNTLTGFGAIGIELSGVASAHVSENAISSSSSPSGVAIESVNSTNLVEFDNVADLDPMGILDLGGVNVTLSDNIFAHTGSGGPTIELENDAQVTAYQNDFTNLSQAALSANGVRAAKITENYVAGAGGPGIAVANSSAVTVTDNAIRDGGRAGLSLANSSDCVEWGNSVRWTQPSPNATAVLVAFDTAPTVAFNNVSAAWLALAVLNSSNASLIANNASDSGTGLSLVGDANSLVVANNLWNDNLSFAVAANLGLAIYHNNFGANGGWTASAGPASITWSAGYPEGGNFWSNHTGPDVRSGADQAGQGPDGIVDTPVDLGVAGIDPYPLTTRWTPTYAIFAESGLLSATPWSLIVNGVRLTSVAPGPILYPETNAPNATVAWTVPPVPGFTLAGVAVGGPWPEVRGANLTYLIAFYADRYSASFEEYGLVSGTAWTFIVNGQPEGGNTARVTVSLPNGTYNYLAGSVPGYNLTVGAGVMTVAGPGATVVFVYVAEATTPSAPSLISGATFGLLASGFAIAGFLALVFLGLLLRERRRDRRPAPLTDAAAPPTSSKHP